MNLSAAHCYSASYCYLASATAIFRWSCVLVKGGIFVRCPQCTWCTSRHPSRSCFHLEWTALWTEDTQRPHSCLNVVSGMSCSHHHPLQNCGPATCWICKVVTCNQNVHLYHHWWQTQDVAVKTVLSRSPTYWSSLHLANVHEIP